MTPSTSALSPSTSFDTESPLRAASASITAAHRVIETVFLQAGDAASAAVNALGLLIEALERLRTALDPERLQTIEGQLETAASGLQSLPEGMAARKRGMDHLAGLGQELSGPVEEMRQCLRYLRVYATYVKIGASGVGERSAEFGGFATEVSAHIEGGAQLLDLLAGDLDALSDLLKASLAKESELGERTTAVLQQAPSAILEAGRSLAAHNRRSALAAAPAQERAQAVRRKVAKILAALQVGDITRQRLEHVDSGLVDLDRRMADLPPAEAERLKGLALTFLGAQLDSILADLESEAGVIKATLADFASDAGALMGYLDEMHASDANGGASFLSTLAVQAGAVQALMADILASEAGVGELSRSASTTARQLNDRVDDVQRLQADVQQIALNTRLRCSQIGAQGQPLSVIALELREQATLLNRAAEGALGFIVDITGHASLLGDDQMAVESRTGAISTTISGAVADLHEANAIAATDLAALTSLRFEVDRALRGASRELDIEARVTLPVREAMGGLRGATELDPAGLEAQVEAFAAALDATYTMALEREVHAGVMAELGLRAASVTAEAAEAPAVSDADALDALLF